MAILTVGQIVKRVGVLLDDPAKRGRFMGAVARSIDDYFAQQTRIAAR